MIDGSAGHTSAAILIHFYSLFVIRRLALLISGNGSFT